MFGNNKKLILESYTKGYDEGLSKGYDVGYQSGLVEKHNREWVGQGQGLSLAEKQALVILEKSQF